MSHRTARTTARALHAEAPNSHWLRELMAELAALSGAASLERIQGLWSLTDAETAALFRISRQAVHKWRRGGVPPGRQAVVAQLAESTEILERHLAAHRMAGAVRQRLTALDGRTLYELACEDGIGRLRIDVTRALHVLRGGPYPATPHPFERRG